MRLTIAYLFAATLLVGQSSSARLHAESEWILRQMAVDDPQAAERRAAAFRTYEFEERANHFAILWREMALDYRRHVVNAKKLKALSRAFHDLEKSEGWAGAQR